MAKGANPKTSVAMSKSHNAPPASKGYKAVSADRMEPRHAQGANTGTEKGGKW